MSLTSSQPLPASVVRLTLYAVEPLLLFHPPIISMRADRTVGITGSRHARHISFRAESFLQAAQSVRSSPRLSSPSPPIYVLDTVHESPGSALFTHVRHM